MVNIVSWDDFSKKAEELYLSDPAKVRFTVKYREADGVVVLKMTDDKTGCFGWTFLCGQSRGVINPDCLKYFGSTSRDAKRAEKFSSLIMRYMASRDQ